MLAVCRIRNTQDRDQRRDERAMLRRERRKRLMVRIGARLSMVSRHVCSNLHLETGHADNRTRLQEIEGVLVVVRYLNEMSDVMEQGSDFKNHAAFLVQTVNGLRLIKNLKCNPAHGNAVLLIEGILSPQLKR